MAYAESEVIDSELLELASEKVDDLTFNRIRGIGFDNLTTFQKEKIQKATLLQAQYYSDYGTESGGLSGFNVSGLSMSFSAGASVPDGVSQAAYMLLKQTGLMGRII